MTCRLARTAAIDIEDIADRLDQRDPAAAVHFLEALREVLWLIGERPGIGHERIDITDRDVRFWTALRRYAVVYKVGPPVTIIHVRDWRRNPASLIDE